MKKNDMLKVVTDGEGSKRTWEVVATNQEIEDFEDKIRNINFDDVDWSKYQEEIDEINKAFKELMTPSMKRKIKVFKGEQSFIKNKKTAEDVWNWLDSINDQDNMCYFDCKENFGTEWYEAILKEVKKFKPKRVIDVGSNLNQYGYLFENAGIEYIGIDDNTTTLSPYGFMQPYINSMVKYIQADYKDVVEYFKDDIIISCLCVGYQVPIECVKAKHLIVNDFDKNENCSAKVVW